MNEEEEKIMEALEVMENTLKTLGILTVCLYTYLKSKSEKGDLDAKLTISLMHKLGNDTALEVVEFLEKYNK